MGGRGGRVLPSQTIGRAWESFCQQNSEREGEGGCQEKQSLAGSREPLGLLDKLLRDRKSDEATARRRPCCSAQPLFSCVLHLPHNFPRRLAVLRGGGRALIE